MAGPYYCDLDTAFADQTGVDNTGNEYYGVGGLLAAFIGYGNATALAAGETLYVKGTGNLTRLVKVTVNVDKSGTWAIGDDLQNYNSGGGAAGDDWAGLLVFIDATTLWIELDSGGDVDTVDTADGVDNITQTDNIPGANMTAASAPGMQVKTSGGSPSADTLLKVVGVNGSWTEDGTVFTLDGGGDADFCIDSDKNGYEYRNMVLTNSTGDCFNTSGLNYVFMNCSATSSAGGSGFNCNRGVFVSCEASLNNIRGFFCIDTNFLMSAAIGNGSHGFSLVRICCIGCVSHFNSSSGVFGIDYGNLVFGCAIDGNGASGVWTLDGPFVVSCSRITNNTTGQITGMSATIYDLWNFLDSVNPTSGSSVYPNFKGSSTRLTGTDEGYFDLAGDDFRQKVGSVGYRTEIDIDGVNAIYTNRGLPTMVLPKIGDEG